jgi:hypothetical protein
MERMVREYQALLSIYRNKLTFERCKCCNTRFYVLYNLKNLPTLYLKLKKSLGHLDSDGRIIVKYISK